MDSQPKIRLLFATAETCPTFRVDVAVLFGKYLPQNNVYSDVVTGRTPDHVGEVSWGGGKALLCSVSGSSIQNYIQTLFHIARSLFMAKKSQYQAIQLRDLPIAAVFGVIAARLKGLKVFYWMSYPMPEGHIELARERGLSAGVIKYLFPWIRGRIGKLLLYKFVLPRVAHIFVQSNKMREDMAAKGIPWEKMTPVPMGVDLEAISSAGIEPSTDPRLKGKQTLIYLGSMDRPRRIEMLFHMLKLVQKTIPNVLLILAGDTDDKEHRAWLEQQAESIGVTNSIIWTGWLTLVEAHRYVYAADIGLSPVPRGLLLDCASPTKTVEYMALNIPFIANDQPDQALAMTESGAGLCSPCTPEGFAKAAITLLKNSNLRKSSIVAGHSWVSANRSYAKLAEDVAATYRRLLFDVVKP